MPIVTGYSADYSNDTEGYFTATYTGSGDLDGLLVGDDDKLRIGVTQSSVGDVMVLDLAQPGRYEFTYYSTTQDAQHNKVVKNLGEYDVTGDVDLAAVVRAQPIGPLPEPLEANVVDNLTAANLGDSGSSTSQALAATYAPNKVGGKGIARTVLRTDYTTLAAAITAAGPGGTVFYPDGAIVDEAPTTINTPVTLDARRATLRKNGNGPLLTITAAGVKIRRGLTLAGQSATYTGPNILVTGDGTTGDFECEADVQDSEQWGIDFGIGAGKNAVVSGKVSTSNKVVNDAAMTAGSAVLTSASANFTARDVGKGVLVRGAYKAEQPTWSLVTWIVSRQSATQVTLAEPAATTISGELLEYHFPSIRFGLEHDAGTSGDRQLVDVRTGGYLLADIGGASNLQIVGGNCRGMLFTTQGCAKVAIAGMRVATQRLLVRGSQHAIVGNTIQGDVTLDTGTFACAVSGNHTTGEIADRGSRNFVTGKTAARRAVVTGDPRTFTGFSGNTANQAVFLRADGRGMASKVGIHVGTSSGNIAVAVYKNNGFDGSAARPNQRAATSGSVPCPAAGYAEIPLDKAVYVDEGDWLCIVADNSTATFARYGATGATLGLAAGSSQFQNAAFPPPATAASSTAAFSFLLAGIA